MYVHSYETPRFQYFSQQKTQRLKSYILEGGSLEHLCVYILYIYIVGILYLLNFMTI